MKRGMLSIVWLTCVAVGNAQAADNFPRFLNNRATPAVESGQLPDHWSATENVRWKTDIPGLGWASPIVWGDRVFLTTCINEGEGLAPRKGLYIEDLDATKYPPTAEHEWRVLCLSLDTGEVLWQQTPHKGVPPKSHHRKNTLASESPSTDGERVYAYFGNIGMFCYDMDGKLLWEHRTQPVDTSLGWGTAASPVLHGDRIYIINDNEEESYLLALDKRTGEQVWRIERDAKSNWATPFIWENELRTEIITSAVGALRSYDLDGNLLWQLGRTSVIAIPTPFAHEGLLYAATGYVLSNTNPIYAIRPGASGDISLEEGQTSNDYVAWTVERYGPYNPTPVIAGGQLYVLHDRGIMISFDAKTGEEIYPRQRIPNGKAFTSSPWAAGGNIFCLNEDGVTFVIKGGPEFEILHTNALAQDDMCMASPAIVDGKLLIRSSERIYCIEQGAEVAAGK